LVFLVKDGVTGLHVPTAAPQALADKLQHLLENDAELRRLGQQAAKYASGFGWGKVADRMIDVYEDLAPNTAQAQSAGQ